MATYFARKNGNVNATDVWATTPTGTASDVFSSFTNADVLMSNNFTVTLNVNTTVKEVRNDTTGGATAGGSFTLSSGITLTADVFAGTATCVNHSSGNSTIVGNVNAGTGNSALGVNFTSSGTLTVTGSSQGGSNTNAIGLYCNGAGAVTVTGNSTGGSGSGAAGVQVASSGSFTITGSVTGGSGSGNAAGIFVSSGATITVTGTVTGGSGVAGIIASTGSITVAGTCVGATAAGASNGSTGTITVTRAKGGPLAASAVGVAAGASSVTNVEEVEWGDLGASPTSGPIRLSDKTSNVAVMYRFGTTKKTLVDTASTSLIPAASDVRFGVSYNSGATTGTCRVPTAANVLQGVLVDNTTGTALMTPADFWAYATASATTAGSIGERLKNAATLASVGQALSDALTP